MNYTAIAESISTMSNFSNCSFGFVDFGDEEACKAAADSMHDAEVDGRNIKVDFAAERGSGGGRGRGELSLRGKKLIILSPKVLFPRRSLLTHAMMTKR